MYLMYLMLTALKVLRNIRMEITLLSASICPFCRVNTSCYFPEIPSGEQGLQGGHELSVLSQGGITK